MMAESNYDPPRLDKTHGYFQRIRQHLVAEARDMVIMPSSQNVAEQKSSEISPFGNNLEPDNCVRNYTSLRLSQGVPYAGPYQQQQLQQQRVSQQQQQRLSEQLPQQQQPQQQQPLQQRLSQQQQPLQQRQQLYGEPLDARSASSASMIPQQNTTKKSPIDTIDFPSLEGVNQEICAMVHLADCMGYAPPAPQFIACMIIDPTKPTNKTVNAVAIVIVQRACEDKKYAEIAAVICNHIQELEDKLQATLTIPWPRFPKAVDDECRFRMENAGRMRDYSLQQWISYVRFLIEYNRVKRGSKFGTVQTLLLDAMTHLAQPPCCQSRAEVKVLKRAVELCGADLKAFNEERWNWIICLLRDSFIDLPPGCDVSRLILHCITLNAADWNLERVNSIMSVM